MKWLVIAVVLALVGYVAFSGGDDEAEVAPAATAIPAVPGADGAGSASGSGSDRDSAPAQITTTEELKTEIEQLMSELDRYSDDAVRRSEIQAEIDALMREYDNADLPFALDGTQN